MRFIVPSIAAIPVILCMASALAQPMPPGGPGPGGPGGPPPGPGFADRPPPPPPPPPPRRPEIIEDGPRCHLVRQRYWDGEQYVVRRVEICD